MQFRSNEINNIVNAGRINELVKISEYKHQVQIENIVRIIASYNEYTKNSPITNGVFVTGPSSSGKTTTAKLIAKELEKNGYRAVHISLDDYYLTNEEILSSSFITLIAFFLSHIGSVVHLVLMI